jgi:hypothetical protein
MPQIAHCAEPISDRNSHAGQEPASGIALVAFLLVIAAAQPARADKFQDDLDKLTAGLPKDAAAMVERRANCNHWQGEEPYDKARGREIDRALTRFGCDFIARDEEKLRARYADKPAIIKALVRGGIFRAPPPRRKVAASVANGTMTTPWHG